MNSSELSTAQIQVQEEYERLVAKMKLMLFKYYKEERVTLLDKEIFDFLHSYVNKFFPEGLEIEHFNRSEKKGSKEDLLILRINKRLQDNYRLLYPITFLSLYLVCYLATSIVVHSYISYFLALIVGSLIYFVVYSQFELEKKVTEIIDLCYYRVKKINISHWHKITLKAKGERLFVGYRDDERYYREKDLFTFNIPLERGKPFEFIAILPLLHLFPTGSSFDLEFEYQSKKFLEDPNYTTNPLIIRTRRGRRRVRTL